MPAEPPAQRSPDVVYRDEVGNRSPASTRSAEASQCSQAAAGKATMVSEQRLMSLEDIKNFQRIVHNRNELHIAWSELYNDGKPVTVPCKTCPGAKKNESDPNAPEPNINGDWYVRVDGQLGPRHDGIGDMAFSPDGKRLAYGALRKGKYFVVVDGRPVPGYDNYDDIGDNSITFSLDSKHLVYKAQRGDKWFLVVDGQPGPAYDKLPFKLVVTNDAVEYLAEHDGWVFRCRQPF